ncbi:Similar to ngdn: Neuroguidin (Xenopus tropicalis) [Cotesia congregata]|uniref:Similar to ngdn: Neuroguidin (Xenopus tropicalis) n=1 Tax=Cotesia congregata TaxID=51543 RepID=A0A8J2MXR7_COTCN|nr:Similar to ngdn: Neuroguidin (Xenopus tropicalis) [Cotesia congregata]
MEEKDLAQSLSLLIEMNASVIEVNKLVELMMSRAKNNELSTSKGLSFLETKYHMLLSYLINLTYIIIKKCSGEQIEGSPSIDRLVEIKTVLEKIKPIDYKLKYQIEKLVRSTMSVGDDMDPTKFKANPEAFAAKIDDDDEDESESDDQDGEAKDSDKKKSKKGVYVPPKISAHHYDGDDTKLEKIRKAEERSRRQAVSGAILRELKEEFLETPMEDSLDREKKIDLSNEHKEKIEYEETYMTRLPVSKQEKHRNRQMSTLGTLGDEITSFGGPSAGKKRRVGKEKTKKRFKKKRNF